MGFVLCVCLPLTRSLAGLPRVRHSLSRAGHSLEDFEGNFARAIYTRRNNRARVTRLASRSSRNKSCISTADTVPHKLFAHRSYFRDDINPIDVYIQALYCVCVFFLFFYQHTVRTSVRSLRADVEFLAIQLVFALSNCSAFFFFFAFDNQRCSFGNFT